MQYNQFVTNITGQTNTVTCEEYLLNSLAPSWQVN